MTRRLLNITKCKLKVSNYLYTRSTQQLWNWRWRAIFKRCVRPQRACVTLVRMSVHMYATHVRTWTFVVQHQPISGREISVIRGAGVGATRRWGLLCKVGCCWQWVDTEQGSSNGICWYYALVCRGRIRIPYAVELHIIIFLHLVWFWQRESLVRCAHSWFSLPKPHSKVTSHYHLST